MDLTPKILELGREVPREELKNKDLFQPEEGFVQMIYGRIRQGKSTEAVRRMYESLTNGKVVYSNIRLDLSSVFFDDRLQISLATSNFLWQQKRYYRFHKENFHWFNPTTGECDGKIVFDPQKRGDEIRWLNTLTDCEIYYDEGQWLLDSYESTSASIAKRKLITETGHMNRLIVIIAQRTQSVHVNARGNVNQFYRCQKVFKYWFFRGLQVEEFQDMKGQDVDEDAPPVSVHTYFVNKKYWRLFNTHYLRAGRPKSQDVYFSAYDLSFSERLSLLYFHMFNKVLGFARIFIRLKPDKDAGAPEARSKNFEHHEDDAQEPLGVESDSTAIKNGERLNTVPVGGNPPIPRRKRLDFKKLREEREAQKALKDQERLPF